MVQGVSVVKGSLHGGGEPGRGGVNFSGRANHAEVCQTSLVGQEQVQGAKSGLYCEDVGWSAGETVCTTSRDLVQEDR